MTTTQNRLGILLVNLGTPDAPTPKAVRRYLREFLWDKRVVDLPRVLWWFLLQGVIVPFRSYRTAHAYQQIWKQEGSPLRVYSQQVAEGLKTLLASRLEDSVEVVLGMRYGTPSLENSLLQLQRANITQLVVLPLYPQYSLATTASVFDAVTAQLKSWAFFPSVKIINHYAENSHYIDALVASIRHHWQTQGQAQHLLFSFHGIPKRYVTAGDPYEAMCHETVKRITEKLNLKEGTWSLAFQSRFGRAQWLEPYCDQVIKVMPSQGISHLDVICPGFAVDCLETLEEIAIRYKSLFISAGGKQFHYIPALNAHPNHLEALASIMALLNNSN